MKRKSPRSRMIKFCLVLFASFISVSLIQAQAVVPEMTVFGIKMNEKLSIPECKIVENKIDKKLGKYLYESSSDIENVCFMRNLFDAEYKNAAPPFASPQDKKIKIQFPFSQALKLAAYTHLEGFVDGQGKLTELSFETKAGDADFILQSLTDKYGRPGSLKEYTQQNVFGATLGNYFVAEWSFPQLAIRFQSADERGGNFSYQGKVIIKAQEAKTDTRTPI